MNEPLLEAVRLAGGQEALASKIGVGQSLVSYWLKKAKKGVSADRVLAIEELTGVPRHRLRPDIFPHPSIQDQPATASDFDVVAPESPQGVDLGLPEHPNSLSVPGGDVDVDGCRTGAFTETPETD